MPKELHRLSRKDFILTPKSDTTTFINYDKEKRILEVEFTEGTYHYFNVPLKVWKNYKAVVESGGSSGKFVNLIIKPMYKYEKID